MTENNKQDKEVKVFKAEYKKEAKVFKAEYKKNYGGSFKADEDEIQSYTKKQMKQLYPQGNYKVLGEVVPGSSAEAIGTLENKTKKHKVYSLNSHNRLIHSIKGYVATGDEDQYVALVKKALLPRLIMLVALIAVIACGVYFIASAAPEEAIAQNSPTKTIELEGVDWQGTLPKDTGSVEPGIAIPGYKSITIAADTTDVTVSFVNPEGNPCYFEISLRLSDGTVLYQSKMVEPGKGLYNITMSQPLAKGEYDAVVKYETYSLTDLSPMNGAEVNIKLIAQ